MDHINATESRSDTIKRLIKQLLQSLQNRPAVWLGIKLDETDDFSLARILNMTYGELVKVLVAIGLIKELKNGSNALKKESVEDLLGLEKSECRLGTHNNQIHTMVLIGNFGSTPRFGASAQLKDKLVGPPNIFLSRQQREWLDEIRSLVFQEPEEDEPMTENEDQGNGTSSTRADEEEGGAEGDALELLEEKKLFNDFFLQFVNPAVYDKPEFWRNGNANTNTQAMIHALLKTAVELCS